MTDIPKMGRGREIHGPVSVCPFNDAGRITTECVRAVQGGAVRDDTVGEIASWNYEKCWRRLGSVEGTLLD